jgi:ferrous iron transport protein B
MGKMFEELTVALAGNPNSGKTTIFNALTGARQHVGNWPGVTVEKKEGTLSHKGTRIRVVDLPGIYSLTALSEEEIIARNFILEGGADIVVCVLDAANLERNLYLAVQLMEMGAKVVLALNMIDVANGRGILINDRKLSRLLGIPVVPTNGKKGSGVQVLIDKVVGAYFSPGNGDRPFRVTYPEDVEEALERIENLLRKSGLSLSGTPARWFTVKLLEQDSEVQKSLSGLPAANELLEAAARSADRLEKVYGDGPEILLADSRYGYISGVMRSAVRVEEPDRVHLSDKIDMVLTNRLFGPLILLFILYGVYQFTFVGSEGIVGYFEDFFGWLGDAVAASIPNGLVRSLVVSGIIDGVGGVLGFTPLIAFMFFAIAILEDSGYMARIAFMLDRVLRGFGMHGASMLALMVSGGIAGGCAVPGVMATRTMREPKERLVTILVTPLLNCGAKLPVYALLLAAFFPGDKAGMMMILTGISWSMMLIAAKVIRSTVLSGPAAPFVIELPPYRVPTLKGLLIHAWERTWMYVKKAGTVILAVSIVLWAMMTFPSLPAERHKVFDKRVEKATATFLALPVVKEHFRSRKDLEAFEKYLTVTDDTGKSTKPENPFFAPLARRLKGEKPKEAIGADPEVSAVTAAYGKLSAERSSIENARKTAELKNTIGGRIGVALEYVFSPMNFDWRTNIALIGGFAAKEVVVATLGTAYSLGDVDPEESDSLSEKLRKEPGWTALTAFSLIIFVMLYAPCFVTLVVMKKETGGWRWPLFAMVYTTVLAYSAAMAVSVVGRALGMGV